MPHQASAPSPCEPLRIALYNEFTLVAPHIARELSTVSHLVTVRTLRQGDPIVQPFDAVLVDPTTLPDEHRWHHVRALSQHPHVTMVALYAGYLSPDWLNEARRNGVRGHLLKSLPCRELMLQIVRLLHEPEPPRHSPEWPGQTAGLTLREADVLALVAAGKSNDEIARLLGVSINTVKTYIRTAYRKAGVTSRSQAVRWALEHRLVEHEPPVVRHGTRQR